VRQPIEVNTALRNFSLHHGFTLGATGEARNRRCLSPHG
jgi:hypothetical protein